MTREAQLRVQHRALQRRQGKPVDVDREEGKAMAEALLAGLSAEAIAKRHGLSRRKVARRLYSMGVYREMRP